MSHNQWKQEIFTLPNLLSLLRLLLIPVYLYVYHHARQDRDYFLAGAILALSCITDLADGKIARDLNMISRVGKVLDPLADKLTQFALLITLAEKYPFLYPITGLFVLKEVFQLAAMLVFLGKGQALNGALGAGKVCTAVLFASLTLLILFPRLDQGIVYSLMILDTILLIASFYSYILAYFGKHNKLTNLETE